MSKFRIMLKKASPIILSAISVIGVFGTTYLAIKATPKAMELIREKSRDSHDGDSEAYTKLEAVQSCWKCYIPSAVTGFATITCIVGSTLLSKRNQASILSAYGVLDQAFRQYRNAANTIYGEDADSKIIAQVAKESYVSAGGYELYSREMDPDSEELLFYDFHSQRYFHATMASVLNAQYHVNRNLALRGDVPVNEFYEFLGIDGIKGGDEVGWDMNDFYDDGIVWLDFENYKTKLEDGMECLVISSAWGPKRFDYAES